MKMEDYKLENMLLGSLRKKKPDLRLPPGTITNVYVDSTFLWSDGESVGAAEIQAWVKTSTHLYCFDSIDDEDVIDIVELTNINYDWTNYGDNYTLYSFEVDESELTLYVFVVEDDCDTDVMYPNDTWLTTSSRYFTIQIESTYAENVNEVRFWIDHEHIYP